MKKFSTLILPLAVLLIALAPYSLDAVDRMATIKMSGDQARITQIKGVAFLLSKEGEPEKVLSSGDILTKGSRIRTEKNSRIEIKLPDNSFIRFDELTTFELEAVRADKQQRRRNIGIRMVLGKAWAKVSRFFSNRGRFSISTRTAVAGVRGTVYRMNVNEDNSAVVKVYQGEVEVKSLTAQEKADAFRNLSEDKTAPAAGPRPVAGPRPIPGPRPVSLEEWTHIVSSMQQIVINADGTATKPFRFSPKADENDWVRYNQERDEAVKDQVEGAREEK